MTSGPRTLDSLARGEEGIVGHVDGDGMVVRRLMEMGLVPGTSVRMVRVAPFGDPYEFIVRGYHLTLRRAEASRVSLRA